MKASRCTEINTSGWTLCFQFRHNYYGVWIRCGRKAVYAFHICFRPAPEFGRWNVRFHEFYLIHSDKLTLFDAANGSCGRWGKKITNTGCVCVCVSVWTEKPSSAQTHTLFSAELQNWRGETDRKYHFHFIAFISKYKLICNRMEISIPSKPHKLDGAMVFRGCQNRKRISFSTN